MVQTGSYFSIRRFEVLFDRLMKESDALDRTVIHVWAQPSLLSLGIPGSNLRYCAFRATTSGELLVLCHFLRRLPWGGRVYRRGSDSGSGASSRCLTGNWATVAH